MDKIPFTNETDRFMHVGGVMIPPHDTRDVDPRLLAGATTESPAPAAEDDDPLLAILAAKVGAAIVGLPALSNEELARLGELEAAHKNRKTLIEAIAVEQLARAEKAAAENTPGASDDPADDPAPNGAGEAGGGCED